MDDATIDEVAIDDVVILDDDRVEHTMDDVLIAMDVIVDPIIDENTIFFVSILDSTRRLDRINAVDVDNVEPYIYENPI